MLENQVLKNRNFSAGVFLRNKHIQTLYSNFFRKTKPLFLKKEIFELDDGDFLECHWNRIHSEEQVKGVVILFHGLEGSYKSPYIRGLMSALEEENYHCVIMHFRGCGDQINRLERAYHSGETEDAKTWITEVKQRYPGMKVYGVGFSLGANMLLKLLSEVSNKSNERFLDAAVSVSAPMKLEVCADQMDRGFSKIYQHHLMKHLKQSLLDKYQQHDMKSLIGLDPKEVKEMRTFWEFDEKYTAPVHGFSSAKEYYQKSSARQYLKKIKIPTLIIHAADDPFMTTEILPEPHELSAQIQLEVYEHGGHVGFIAGSLWKPQYWLDKRIVDFLKSFEVGNGDPKEI